MAASRFFSNDFGSSSGSSSGSGSGSKHAPASVSDSGSGPDLDSNKESWSIVPGTARYGTCPRCEQIADSSFPYVAPPTDPNEDSSRCTLCGVIAFPDEDGEALLARPEGANLGLEPTIEVTAQQIKLDGTTFFQELPNNLTGARDLLVCPGCCIPMPNGVVVCNRDCRGGAPCDGAPSAPQSPCSICGRLLVKEGDTKTVVLFAEPNFNELPFCSVQVTSFRSAVPLPGIGPGMVAQPTCHVTGKTLWTFTAAYVTYTCSGL